MPDYIEREAFRRKLEEIYMGFSGYKTRVTFWKSVELLDGFPSAGVAPVRHGRWEVDEFGHFCTVCREYTEEVENGEGQLDPLITPYCPNCGAEMDKEE